MIKANCYEDIRHFLDALDGLLLLAYTDYGTRSRRRHCRRPWSSGKRARHGQGDGRGGERGGELNLLMCVWIILLVLRVQVLFDYASFVRTIMAKFLGHTKIGFETYVYQLADLVEYMREANHERGQAQGSGHDQVSIQEGGAARSR